MAELPRDTIYHYESKDGLSITVTMTELVRCKDCKYRGTTDCVSYNAFWELGDEGFCSVGERKEDGTN